MGKETNNNSTVVKLGKKFGSAAGFRGRREMNTEDRRSRRVERRFSVQMSPGSDLSAKLNRPSYFLGKSWGSDCCWEQVCRQFTLALTCFCEPAASEAVACSFRADVPRSCKALCERVVEVITSENLVSYPWPQLLNAIDPFPGLAGRCAL